MCTGIRDPRQKCCDVRQNPTGRKVRGGGVLVGDRWVVPRCGGCMPWGFPGGFLVKERPYEKVSCAAACSVVAVEGAGGYEADAGGRVDSRDSHRPAGRHGRRDDTGPDFGPVHAAGRGHPDRSGRGRAGGRPVGEDRAVGRAGGRRDQAGRGRQGGCRGTAGQDGRGVHGQCGSGRAGRRSGCAGRREPAGQGAVRREGRPRPAGFGADRRGRGADSGYGRADRRPERAAGQGRGAAERRPDRQGRGRRRHDQAGRRRAVGPEGRRYGRQGQDGRADRRHDGAGHAEDRRTEP